MAKRTTETDGGKGEGSLAVLSTLGAVVAFFVCWGVSVQASPNGWAHPFLIPTVISLVGLYLTMDAIAEANGWKLDFGAVTDRLIPGSLGRFGQTAAAILVPVVFIGYVALLDIGAGRAYVAEAVRVGDKYADWPEGIGFVVIGLILMFWLAYILATLAWVNSLKADERAVNEFADSLALVFGERSDRLAEVMTFYGDRVILHGSIAKPLNRAVNEPDDVDRQLATQAPGYEMTVCDPTRRLIVLGPVSAETRRRRSIRASSGGREADRADEANDGQYPSLDFTQPVETNSSLDLNWEV